MRFIKKASIVGKISVLIGVLAFIFLSATYTYVLLNVRSSMIETSLQKLRAEVDSSAYAIEVVADQVQDTVRSLKGFPPIQGIIRAKANEGVDPISNSSVTQWRERMDTIFASEIQSTGLFDQLRYIDEEGQEIVRVDYLYNSATIVSPSKLQNKRSRDYFIEASALSEGELYVSKTELNREGDPPTISIPYRPVIRYAVPVFNAEDGEKRGIVIANVLVDQLISKSTLSDKQSSNLYIFGSQGYFIYNPDSTKEWGGPRDLDTKYSFSTEFPYLESSQFEQDSGSFYTKEGFFAFSKFNPDSQDISRQWTILVFTPNQEVLEPINLIIKNASIIGFGTFLILLFVFLFILRTLFSPLKELAEGARQVGAGDFSVQLNVHSLDEIGRVTVAFNSMITQLKEVYATLDNKVKEQTAKLSVQVADLQDSQKAVASILEDVEEEKNKSELLVQEMNKFKLAVENTSDMVIISDAKANILYVNGAVETITGYSQEEILGTKAGTVLGGDMEKPFYKDMWDTLLANKTWSGQIKNRKKDGTFFEVAMSVSPIANNFGEIIFFVDISRDVTREADIDRAKTEFVSLASHQLRTPLSTINWYAEMLMAEDVGKLNTEQKQFMQEIYTGNQRMVDLVNSLLNVSRIELGTFMIEPEECLLADMITAELKELKPLIEEKGLAVNTKLSKSVPKMMLDPKLTRIVVDNLLTNAVKYTPKDGSVSVTLVKKGDNARITIKDTGYGIPVAQQDKIFTKLFRADNVQEKDTTGTGLGLYMVKSILNHSGGKVWFESEEEVGTTFYVEIPLSGMKQKEGQKKLD